MEALSDWQGKLVFISQFYNHAQWLKVLAGHWTISYPEPSNFLPRMLDENEGLWKGPMFR